MRCPRCSTELPDAAKFCFECGLSLSAAAAPALASPERYTPKHLADRILVSRSALEGERKQVTVLFCDLANSTPLAERLGPEGMHAFLNRFFELALAEVHGFEGTVNQFLGDGFMALFGAPLAHEDDARRAVMAALGVRRALRDRASWMGAGLGSEVAVRIGLNTGPVVIGRIGDNLRMDYTAVGDTTNVAARLQQVARPGDILISDATARLVRSEIRLDPLGALSVKGKSEPVVAYRVRGVAPRRSLLEQAAERAFARFVGREAERDHLARFAAEVVQGRGHIVNVVGEAGSGKSRLLYEVGRSLGEAKQLKVLEARCRSFGTGTPYLPIIDLVRDDCDVLDTDTPEAIGDKVRLVVDDLGMDREASLPYLLRLLGVKQSAEAVDDVPAEVVKTRTLEALTQVLCLGSRRRPLLVVIEDVHWIDPPSEEYVVQLARALADAPLGLVTTARPGYRPPWLDPARSTEIVLRPLSDGDSRAVVESVVQRRRLPERLVETILDKADGNPLFLEELTRAVLDRQDFDATPAVPETLQGVLTARIDRLPEATKRLLQTAAVLGRELSLHLLEAIWDGPGSALSHLEELTRLEFVHPRLGEEPAYAFNHALTQEVAYESLLVSHRRALHAAAGRALETLFAGRLDRVLDSLAFHFSRAEEAERAIQYLARLADRAMRAYANVAAVRALDEALGHAAALPEPDRVRARVELVLQKSEALFLLGELQPSVDLLRAERAGVERLGDPRLAGAYDIRLASAHGLLGESQAAAELAERALAAGRAAGDRSIVGRAHYVLARESFWSGRLREGVDHGRRAAALAEAGSDRWWLSMAHWAMAVNYALLGEFDFALQAAASAQSAADRVQDPRLASNAAWVVGWVRAMQGAWAAGIEACKRSVELAPDGFSRALATAFLGVVHLEKGDAGAARPLLDEARAAVSRFRFAQLEGWLTIFEAQADLAEGDLETARARVARGIEIARRARFSPALAAAERVLGEVARREGKLDDAEAHVRRSLEILEPMEARFEVARAHVALGELAQARGDRHAAAAELGEARRLFEALGAGPHAARVRHRAEELGVPVG